jgi:hypothetical protein
MILKDIISHVRDRNYLSEIDRNYLRVKATGEVFTPLIIITKKLNDLESYDPNIFKDVTKTFLEPSCGDGNFLSEVLIRKIENGSTFEQALSTIYGVDLMQDNVDLCRERLLCGQEQFRHIVEQNIQCRDALKFGYNFKSMGPARRETEDKARAKQQRLKVKQEKIEKLEEAKKKKEAQQKKLFGEIIPEFV